MEDIFLKKRKEYTKKVEKWYQESGAVDRIGDSEEYLADNLSIELDDISDKNLKKRKREKVTVLDIGAGSQAFVRYFTRLYRGRKGVSKLTMIPLDALDVNKINITPSEYTVVGDALRLPIRKNSFEIVISNMLISIFPEEKILPEILEVLKPGGVALLNFYRLDDMKEELKIGKGLARGNNQEIKQRFIDAGFVNVELNERITDKDDWIEVRAEKPKEQ